MKNFLRPSIWKIVITLLIIASHLLVIGMGFSCGWDNQSAETFKCKYIALPFVQSIMAPSNFIVAAIDVKFNPFEYSANYQIAIIVQIIWSYILACFAIEIFRSISKEDVKSSLIKFLILIILISLMILGSSNIRTSKQNEFLIGQGFDPSIKTNNECEQKGFTWTGFHCFIGFDENR